MRAPIANRQPYEITETGRAQLVASLVGVRKLAEVAPNEATRVPSYYARIDEADVDKELLVNAAVPKVVDPLSLPFSQLGGRRFEILTYLVKREDEGPNGQVVLVKASRDGGRDVLVYRASKLVAIIQCKNLQGKLSLLALQEELLKLILHDYRERFIPDEGIQYEVWAPGGFAEITETFIRCRQLSFQEGDWIEVFKRVTKAYRKLFSLQWNDVQNHVRIALTERITIVPHDGIVLTQKTQSHPVLYSRFFDVVNVWKKEDVEQALSLQFNDFAVHVGRLTAAPEGSAGDLIDEQINEARELINKGQFGEAEAVLRLLERKRGHLLTNRQRFRVESNKGAIAYSQNRLEDSAQLFLQAARLEPDDERGQENEVFAYYLLRDFPKAHTLAAKRKELLPSSARIAAFWANTAPKAMSPADIEAGISPALLDQHEVSIALARRYMGAHQLESAERLIQSAKLSAPKWSQPWLVEAQIAIGKLLEENAGIRQIPQADRPSVLQRGIDAAGTAFDFSVTDGNWAKAEALTLRAQLYLMRDEVEFATADAKAAYLLDADSVSVLLTLAQVHLAARALDLALEVLQEAYQKEARADVVLMYSKALVQRGKDEDVATAWRVISKVALASLPRLIVFGVAAQTMATATRLSFWDEAQAYLGGAEATLDQASGSTLQSYLLMRKGHTEAALTAATKALGKVDGSTHAQVIELLGQALLELQRPELAIDLFRKLFDQRVVTFDPRQLLMCAYRLHRDDDVMAICEELHARGSVAWDILEFELQQLEKYNIPRAVARIQDFLREHADNKLALLRLSVIGVLHGLPDLISAKPEEMPPVEQLPVEYLMPALGVMRKAAEGDQAIDYAYRYLRLHFDQREAHEAFIQVVISRADRETEPDLEVVVPGAAVYTEETFSGQGRWFVLEDTNTPLHAFEEIAPEDLKTKALLGKRVGEKVVLAPASMANREAIVKKILPKYVRRFQDCMAELQVRFGTSTMIQSVHVGGPDSIVEPALVSMMTSVRERAERVMKLQRTYAEQPLMSLHVYGSAFGKNSYESIQHLAVTPETSVRCFNGDPVEANAALLFLKERPDLLIDLSVFATLRLLGLEWIFSAKVHRFCITQGTWEELRSTLIDDIVSTGRRGTMIYRADGYSFEEETASASDLRREEDEAFLSSIQANVTVVPAEQLATQTHELRDTLVKYLGEYGAEAAAVASGTGCLLWTDDSQVAAAAQSLLGARRVWTQIVLISFVEAGVMTREDYATSVAKLIGMKYSGVFFDSRCVLESARLAEYRPSRFPLVQMAETFATTTAPPEGLIKTFLEFFVLMQQEPLLFHKRSLVTGSLLDALWANPNTNQYVLPLRKMGTRLFGLNVIAEAEFAAAFDAWFTSLANRRIG